MKNKITGIIFDLDGVLIDSKNWHSSSFCQALNTHGISFTEHEHSERFEALPTKMKLNTLIQEGRVHPNLYESICDLKQYFTKKTIEENCFPDLEIKSILSSLRLKNIRLGLCTNAIRSTMDLILDKMMIIEYFEVRFSSSDVNFAKPNPEIYRKALQSMKMDSQNVLILEDSEIGIEAALHSGAHVLKIKNRNDLSLAKIENFLNGNILDHALE